MTFKKYKIVDIVVLTLIAILVDMISFWLMGTASGDGSFNFFVTPSIVLIMIIYIRWGSIGIVPNLIIAVIHSIVYQKELLVHYNRWIPYLIGYMVIFLSILWKKLLGSVIINNRITMTALYILVNLTLMTVVEWSVALTLGSNEVIDTYIIRNLVNVFIALVAFIIATYQKGLVVDAKSYLLQMKKEEEEAKNG